MFFQQLQISNTDDNNIMNNMNDINESKEQKIEEQEEEELEIPNENDLSHPLDRQVSSKYLLKQKKREERKKLRQNRLNLMKFAKNRESTYDLFQYIYIYIIYTQYIYPCTQIFYV